MAPQVTIWRTARTIREAKRYARAMRTLGLTVSMSIDGVWTDEAGKVCYPVGARITSWRKGVVRGRYPNPKFRVVVTATDRSRICVIGAGPRSSPWEPSL